MDAHGLAMISTVLLAVSVATQMKATMPQVKECFVGVMKDQRELNGQGKQLCAYAACCEEWYQSLIKLTVACVVCPVGPYFSGYGARGSR